MEHKEIARDDIQKLITFLRQNLKKLEDEADQKAFTDVTGWLETALTMVENNKYATCLYDAATKYVNQLAFRLHVENALDEETDKIFRGFETVKQVSEYAAAYTSEDKARADEITKLQQAYMEEREPFEVFQSVIGGLSEEEAKQKLAAHKERQAAAIQNAKDNGQI